MKVIDKIYDYVNGDRYVIETPACLHCDDTGTVEIFTQELYYLNQGMHVQEAVTSLNKDYREDLGENQVGKDILNVFENSFRKPMKDLDENSKQAFLKYFQLLSNLSEKYSS